MTNRLAGAISPYLRQHADNPVDWWPWGDEAFAQARHRDVPILLSVGYAACHWCHVMAHESFEDPATARLLNERFVAVKVDREERPDVDAVYMAATQAMTGSGGWPMTVALDHEGRAFFAGTYFPRVARAGTPSFVEVLRALDDAWQHDRERVARAASHVHDSLTRTIVTTAGTELPTWTDVANAIDRLGGDADRERGGFGRAPKFPSPPVLEFLLRAAALRRGPGSPAGPGPAGEPPPADAARTMAERTLAAMARGGLYDQLAGGFARYSVDADWVVPHFEKMLADNAQLVRVYSHWWRATGDPLARRVATETADFLLAELRTAEGGFASSLDADTDGREGAFYVWTPEQLISVLGPEDGAWAARLCSVTAAGSFEHGTSVLQLRADLDDPGRWQRCRAALARARAQRPRPARDDKVVAAWNGLAIAGLAEAGALFDRPDLVAAAVTCAQHLSERHWAAGPRHLHRVSLAGRVNTAAPGVLEDHADLAEGLLALYQVTGDEQWYLWAGELMGTVLERFTDGRGGFFDTASDAPALVRRPQDPTDAVAPSGWAAATSALVTLSALSGDAHHRAAAESALAALLPFARRAPRFTGWTWAAATAILAGPVQVAVVLPRDACLPSDPRPGPPTDPLHRTALAGTSPGLVVALAPEGRGQVPLLLGRPTVGGRSTAYPCRGFVCDLPVTSPAQLRAAVDA